MRLRRRAALVAVAAVTAAGVVASLLDRTDLAVALAVLLAGCAAALLLRADQRAGESSAALRATQRDVRRLRKALGSVRNSAASAASVDKIGARVGRTHELLESHRAASTAAQEALAPRLDGVRTALHDIRGELTNDRARFDALDADIADLRKRVAGVRSIVHSGRPGKLLTEVQALDQLRQKFDVEGPLPDVGGWALDPSALLWLVDEIERQRPNHVVECGSGTSTFWIAMALRSNGHGHVVALDHLEEFAGRTRSTLERHGLSDVAEVRHAPLVDTETPRGTFPWYDVDADATGPIDLLVVDGPPASTGRLARYPALPVLAESLTRPASVLVDDVHRKDEREIVERWLEEFPTLRRAGHTNDSSEVLTYG